MAQKRGTFLTENSFIMHVPNNRNGIFFICDLIVMAIYKHKLQQYVNSYEQNKNCVSMAVHTCKDNRTSVCCIRLCNCRKMLCAFDLFRIQCSVDTNLFIDDRYKFIFGRVMLCDTYFIDQFWIEHLSLRYDLLIMIGDVDNNFAAVCINEMC